jgi:CspA family cold shock protein|tara:strand:+ start:366 stop:557 length:192 start_codon:yes stop_codon:yes gene_type:complete
MNKGTVKFFNESKGFGFINEEGSDKDYFVHSTGLAENIKDGDAVEFELEEDQKGMRAVNVKPI